MAPAPAAGAFERLADLFHGGDELLGIGRRGDQRGLVQFRIILGRGIQRVARDER